MSQSAAGLAALTDGLYAVPIILGSCISMLACAFVLYTYVRFEELRRHPNSIVVTRTLCDAALAFVLIVEQSIRASGQGAELADCRGFSFFFEFLLIASELCVLVMSYDLYIALHNPFIDYKANLRKYWLAVFSVAIIMGSILVGSGPQGASQQHAVD